MTSATLTDHSTSTQTSRSDRFAAMRTVRVLHVIDGQHYADVERVQDLLAAELQRFGYDVGFACLHPEAFPRRRRTQHAPVYSTPMRGRFDLRAVGKLVQVVRGEEYDLLHSHTPESAIVTALVSTLTGVPMVHHVHGPTLKGSARELRARINSVVEHLSLSRASALIAVSGNTKQYAHRRGFNKEKVTLVPNGVASRTPARPRHASQVEWTLGTMARFRPRKGMEVLLRAVAILKEEGLPIRLRAVGDFETSHYETQIKALAEGFDVTELVDWVDFPEDVDSELANMDLLVLPSLFGEGLPAVVLDAMAAGVPVVASRVEGVTEAIRDGQDGLLAEPDNPRDLAAVIRRIITGQVKWKKLRASAIRRHTEQFSGRAMAAGVAKVYARVLDESQ